MKKITKTDGKSLRAAAEKPVKTAPVKAVPAKVDDKSPRDKVLAAMKKPQGVRRSTIKTLFGWERNVTPYDIRAFAKRHRPLKLKVTSAADGEQVYRLTA